MAPAASTIPVPTERAALDAKLALLQAHKTEWARLPIPRKIALLDGVRARTAAVAERWVAAAAEAKGVGAGSPLRGEEWGSGLWTLLLYVEALRETLDGVRRGTHGRRVRGRSRQRADGQTVVRVLPAGLADHIFFGGITADVWLQPGITPTSLPEAVASFYRAPAPAGAVCLVLAAGNVSCLPPTNALYKLYGEGQVCLLKMNPINSWLGGILEEVFAEFISSGYLGFAYGGAEVGMYLTRHGHVDTVHLTGSNATYDAILHGTGEEGRRRRERGDPVVTKPVTSELGGVSPILVVPGPWSEADLRFQAEHVASMKLTNGGFMCMAGQVLVLAEAWPQADAFVAAVRTVLDEIPEHATYYPGAGNRVRAARNEYPDASEWLGPDGSRLLITHVPCDQAEQHAFTTEFFAAALAITRLPGGGTGESPAHFLERAVEFCNERLAGTLAMSILIHPRTIAQLGSRFEDAIARLRYGTIGVNVWTAASYLSGRTPWGAFPRYGRADIQSGNGVVQNALLFDEPEKTVLTGPFAPFPRSLALGERHVAPKPAWFVTHRNAEATVRAAAYYTAAPSPLKLPGVMAAALRG
jgi:aldehyde dehydrogenase (NAD(P)+)